jgi:hypothetical protein
MDDSAAVGILIGVLIFYAIFFIGYIFFIVQCFFSYGTAYRRTRAGGGDGLALYGWMVVFQLASMIPGLGIYFWRKYRYLGEENTAPYRQQPVYAPYGTCPHCGSPAWQGANFCPNCGNPYQVATYTPAAPAELPAQSQG